MIKGIKGTGQLTSTPPPESRQRPRWLVAVPRVGLIGRRLASGSEELLPDA